MKNGKGDIMTEEIRRRAERIILTEEMLLCLLQGKDIQVVVRNEEQKENAFIFKGPWDGVFLTHAQISELEYRAQSSVFAMIEKLTDDKSHLSPKTFNVDSKKE